jgi:hypothetical protein
MGSVKSSTSKFVHKKYRDQSIFRTLSEESPENTNTKIMQVPSPPDVLLASLKLAPLLVHEVDPPQRVDIQLGMYVLLPGARRDRMLQ